MIKGVIMMKKVEVTRADVERLNKNAGCIIAMFERVCTDKMERLKLVSALTGYACHQAVIANGETFIQVGTTDGLIYYFGDAVNYYLLEAPYNLLCFLKGYYENEVKEPKELDINTPIRNAAISVGDSTYQIWGKYSPKSVYMATKDCWQGIFDNLTARFCRKPSEWPVLYAIVLQNILFNMDIDPEEGFFKALECALYISKMDMKSIKQ